MQNLLLQTNHSHWPYDGFSLVLFFFLKTIFISLSPVTNTPRVAMETVTWQVWFDSTFSPVFTLTECTAKVPLEFTAAEPQRFWIRLTRSHWFGSERARRQGQRGPRRQRSSSWSLMLLADKRSTNTLRGQPAFDFIHLWHLPLRVLSPVFNSQLTKAWTEPVLRFKLTW